VEISFSLTGGAEPADLVSLNDWLHGEPGLAGRVRLSVPRPQPGEMGALAEAFVVAVGSGGTLSVLAASLGGWLSHPRRSDIRVRVEAPGQRVVEIGGDRVRASEVESLLRQALDPGPVQE
jgi:hypothetical protein